MALHWATLINYFPCTCTYAPRVPCDDTKSLAAAGRIREQFHGLITDLVRNLISSPPSDERDTSLFLCPKKSPDLEWGVGSADGGTSFGAGVRLRAASFPSYQLFRHRKVDLTETLLTLHSREGVARGPRGPTQ